MNVQERLERFQRLATANLRTALGPSAPEAQVFPHEVPADLGGGADLGGDDDLCGDTLVDDEETQATDGWEHGDMVIPEETQATDGASMVILEETQPVPTSVPTSVGDSSPGAALKRTKDSHRFGPAVKRTKDSPSASASASAPALQPLIVVDPDDDDEEQTVGHPCSKEPWPWVLLARRNRGPHMEIHLSE